MPGTFDRDSQRVWLGRSRKWHCLCPQAAGLCLPLQGVFSNKNRDKPYRIVPIEQAQNTASTHHDKDHRLATTTQQHNKQTKDTPEMIRSTENTAKRHHIRLSENHDHGSRAPAADTAQNQPAKWMRSRKLSSILNCVLFSNKIHNITHHIQYTTCMFINSVGVCI